MNKRHSDGEWTPNTMVRRGALWVRNYAMHYGGEYDYFKRSELLRAAKHLRQDVDAYIHEVEESRRLLGELLLDR